MVQFNFKLLAVIIISFQVLLYCDKEKLNIAVLDLKVVNFPVEESVLLTEVLRSELYKQNLYRVMNREDMKDIMGEQAFQNTGLCDETSCLIEIGKILSAQKIITGSIGKLDSVYSIIVKQIDIETSENEKMINYVQKCSKEKLFDLIKNAALELSGKKPLYIFATTNTIEDNKETVDLESELVLFYNFNRTAKDKSPYKNDANITNCEYSSDKYGIPDNALYFNGDNSKVNCGNNPGLNLSRNMSFALNFKLDSLPEDKTKHFLIHKKGGYSIGIDSKGQISFEFSARDYSKQKSRICPQNISSKPNSLEISRWYNLVIVLDMDSRITRIFLDNSLIASSEINMMKPIINSEELYIGSNISSWTLDDLRIYRRSLSRSEIDNLNKIEAWRVENLIYSEDCKYGVTLKESENPVKSRPVEAKDRFNNEKKAWYFNGRFVYHEFDFLSDFGFDTSSDFSISFWFLQEDLKPEGYRLLDNAVAGRSEGIILDTFGDKYPGQQLRWIPNYKPIYGKTKYSLGKWHHVVLTYDSKNSKIFLDGKLDGESDYNVTLDKNNLPLIIGDSQNKEADPDLYFKGYIDDISFYSRTLKTKEVEFLFHENGWK